MSEKMTPNVRFKGFSDDWEQRKLGNIADLGSSKRIHLRDYAPEGIPFFRGSEISNGGEPSGTKLYISIDLYNQIKKKYGVPEEGDLLISAVGTLGNVWRVDNRKFYYKDGNLILISNIKLDPGYLLQYISDGVGKERVLRSGAGSNQKALTMIKLRQVDIPVPPIFEQNRISLLLQNITNLIASNQKKVDQLKMLKKLFLQKIFDQEWRFRGFTDPWEQRKLKDTSKFHKGSGYSKKDLRHHGQKIILYGSMYTDYHLVINKINTFVEGTSGVYSQKDDVILPASGETATDIARASVVQCPGILLGGDLNVIVPDQKQWNSTFLAALLSNGCIHRQLASLAQGKSVVHLHNDDLKGLTLFCPSIEEQKKIAQWLINLDATIASNQRHPFLLKIRPRPPS